MDELEPVRRIALDQVFDRLAVFVGAAQRDLDQGLLAGSMVVSLNWLGLISPRRGLQLRELGYYASLVIQHFGAIGVPTFDRSKSVPGYCVQPKSSERVAAGAMTLQEVLDGVFDDSLRLDFDALTKTRVTNVASPAGTVPSQPGL